MSNKKLLQSLLSLTTFAFLAAPACRLDPPKGSGRGTGGGSGVCIEDPEDVMMGVGGAGGGAGAGGDMGVGGVGGSAGGSGGGDAGALAASDDINRVITPVACSGTSQSPDVVPLTYTPGYTPDPAVHADGQRAAHQHVAAPTRSSRCTARCSATPSHTQFNDIQRSYDTELDSRLSLPRRLARHEPRRGHGRRPAERRDRQQRAGRILDGVPGQHGPRRGLRPRPRVRRSARRSATRCRRPGDDVAGARA